MGMSDSTYWLTGGRARRAGRGRSTYGSVFRSAFYFSRSVPTTKTVNGVYVHLLVFSFFSFFFFLFHKPF